MRIEDVVESLNEYIREERINKHIDAKSFLVLKKSITPNTTFKAYKDFEYSIYVVKGNTNWHALGLNKMCRATADSELEYIKKICEKELCTNLFKWVHSYYYDQMLTDNYISDGTPDRV